MTNTPPTAAATSDATPDTVPFYRVEHTYSRLGPWSHMPKPNVHRADTLTGYHRQGIPTPDCDGLPSPYQHDQGELAYGFTDMDDVRHYFRGYFYALARDGFTFATYHVPAPFLYRAEITSQACLPFTLYRTLTPTTTTDPRRLIHYAA